MTHGICAAERTRMPLGRAAVLGMALGLAACTAVGEASRTEAPRAPGLLGADFGNAVSHNAAQHIIDPTPKHAQAGPPPLDGARAAEAIKRYRSGAVIAPEAIETSQFGDTR